MYLFIYFIYLFISLKNKLYNNNGKLNKRKKLKQQFVNHRLTLSVCNKNELMN